MTFKYDSFGRRIQKSSSAGTTNYLYDGSNSVEEIDSTGAPLVHYAQGVGIDEPLADVRGGTTTSYEQDGLGSVTSLSGSTGAISNTYVYNTFGVSTTSTGSAVNPFQFTGRDYDPETGLRYYRARYYDDSTGRFMSEDPKRFKGGSAFYIYSKNAPISLRDPSGMLPTRYHWDITYGAGVQILGSKCIQSAIDIADANAEVDALHGWHDWFQFLTKGGDGWRAGGPHFLDIRLALGLTDNAISTCNLKQLGQGLHSVQDSFTHGSQWYDPWFHYFTFSMMDKMAMKDDQHNHGISSITAEILRRFKDRCLPCCKSMQ